MKSKTKNSIAWVLAGILALAFVGSGVTKILGFEMQIKNLESWSFPLWFRFPIGLSEITIAVALLLPSYRKLSTYAIFSWTIAAVITHLQAGQTNMIITPIMFGAIALTIYFLMSEKIKTDLK